MGEEVGSKVASDEHGRTGFGGREGGRDFQKNRWRGCRRPYVTRMEKEGREATFKKLPVAKKVAKRRRPSVRL